MTLFLTFHLGEVFSLFLFFISLTMIIVKGHGNIELLSRSSSTPPLEGFCPVAPGPPAPRISSTPNCLLPYE